MSATVEPARTNWTEAELEALPEDGFIHEVVNGELVMSPKNNWFHGRICTRLIVALGNFISQHELGALLDSSTGFWMFNRNCRAPDVRRFAIGWARNLTGCRCFPRPQNPIL